MVTSKTVAKKPKATKPRVAREDRKEIHSTEIKIDLVNLRRVVKRLALNLESVGGRGESKAQRSAFSAWNVIKHFADQYDNGEDSITMNVSGGTAGSSARIYYFPSVTSMAKPFRDAIVPTKEGNKFLFFDIKAAEFFLNCVFCNETEALKVYQNGDDIYMHYKHLFPTGTEREKIKKVLISHMYETTAYRVGLDLGISETQAQRLIDIVSMQVPKMAMNKSRVIKFARNRNSYWCPDPYSLDIFKNADLPISDVKVETKNLVKVADVDEVKGFKELTALSAFVQSALGVWMAGFIKDLEKELDAQGCRGTILSVFDSILVEISPEKEEYFRSWIDKRIKPFRIGGISQGNTFLEANGK